MNDYHAVMTANRIRNQQLEERASLLAGLGFRPSSGFEWLFRRQAVSLEADFILTRPAMAASSRLQAA